MNSSGRQVTGRDFYNVELKFEERMDMVKQSRFLIVALLYGCAAFAGSSRNLLGAGSGFEVGPLNFIAISEQKYLFRDGESSLYDPENPHEGKYSLRLTKEGIWSLPPIPGREDAHLVIPRTKSADRNRRGCVYFNLVKLEEDKTYTVSAWVRSDVSSQSFLMEVAEPLGDGQFNTETRTFCAGREWNRYSFSFQLKKSKLVNYRYVKISIPNSEGRSTLWIDAVQLEEGGHATDYQAVPLEFGAVIEKPGRIFRGEELDDAHITLRFRNNTESEQECRVRYTMRDYWFKPVAEGTVKMRLAAGSNATEMLKIPALPCGYYRIVFDGDGGVYDEAIFAVYEPMKYTGKLPDYWPLSLEAGDHAMPEGISPLQLMRDIGYGWLRMPVYLNDVGNPDGTFHFEILDPMLEEAKQANVRLLLTLGNSSRRCPAWARDPESKLLNVGVWKNFVGAAVAHCSGQVDTYEMLNEPNHMTPAQYLEYLKSGYKAAKNSDPACRVVGGCATADLGLIPSPWTLELLDLGGGRYMDILSTHLYNDNIPERGRFGVIKHYRIMNEGLKKHNLELPIWHTEKMYCTRVRGYSRRKHDIPPEYPVKPSIWWLARDYRQKAAFCVRDAVLASVCGKGPFTSMGAISLNNTICPRNTYIYEFTHIEYDGSPTPDIPAVNGFARMLEGRCEPGELIELDENAYAAFYHGEKGVLVVLWDVKGGKKLRLPLLPAGRMYNFFGVPIKYSRDVVLEEEPLYLQFDQVPVETVIRIFDRFARKNGKRDHSPE